MQSTFPTHLILLLITITTPGKQYNTWLSSPHSSLYPPVTFSLLDPIFPSASLLETRLYLYCYMEVQWSVRYSGVTHSSLAAAPFTVQAALHALCRNIFHLIDTGQTGSHIVLEGKSLNVHFCTFERSKAECGRHVALCADTRWSQHEASNQPHVQFVCVTWPNVAVATWLPPSKLRLTL